MRRRRRKTRSRSCAARWLDANGLRAPAILAEDAGKGWVLLEDFGDHPHARISRCLAAG
jgi:aminoglycoside/choline kinase family phosphotransferase